VYTLNTTPLKASFDETIFAFLRAFVGATLFGAPAGTGFVFFTLDFFSFFDIALMGLRYHPASGAQLSHPIGCMSHSMGEFRHDISRSVPSMGLRPKDSDSDEH